MRKLIGVALFLLLVCGTYAVGIHTSFEFSTGTNLPTDWQVDQGVPWGLGFGLKVTPTWEDLMDTNATIVNNTDLFYSFTTVPAQMLLEPSSFTFRVTVPASVVTIASDADVAFTPSSLVLRFTPVNMSATLRPSVWSFNLTNDNIVLPQNEDVLLEYTEACYLAGTTTTCDIVTPTSTQQTPLAKAISRPLTLTYGDEDTHLGPANPADFAFSSLTISPIKPFRPSPDIVVTLPLQDASDSSFTATGQFLTGTATGLDVRWCLPGFQNGGGNLTITIYSVWRQYSFNDTFVVLEPVDSVPITMFPPSVVISVNTPAAVFRFTSDIPWLVNVNGVDYDVEKYYIWFRVVESSSTASVIDTAGFPQGAYTMPSLVIAPDPVNFEFVDFVTDYRLPIPIGHRKTGSYRYHVHVEASPLDIGLGADGTITYPFQISPVGAFRILVASNSSPSSFAEVDSFVWTGSQRMIEFIIDTQASPSYLASVNWTFSDPIFSNPRPLSLFGLLGPLYTFTIVPNAMTVQVTNSNGQQRLEDGVIPNQPFTLLFEWTPPTNNGFLITVSASNVVLPDGSTGGNITFTVGPGLTSFLAGPFRALPPTSLELSFADQVVIPMPVTLGNLTGAAATDNAWFYVPTPVLVRIRRDRVYIVNQPLKTDTFFLDMKRFSIDINRNYPYSVAMLSAGGFASQPYCVGVSLNSQFFASGDQEVWVTLYSETVEPGIGTAPGFVNRAGLIFSAIDNPAPAPGVSRAGMPPGTVVLSKANNGIGCFVVAFDRNWPFLSDPIYSDWRASVDAIPDGLPWLQPTIGIWRVQHAISGPTSGLVFEKDSVGRDVMFLPELFAVVQSYVRVSVLQTVPHPARDNESEPYQFFAGESGLVYVTLDEPAQRGLNYALTLTNGVLEAVNTTLFDGKPGFPPGSQGPHIWRVRFDDIPKGAFENGAPWGQYTTSLRLWTYGPDTAYFLGNGQTISMAVSPQLMHIQVPDQDESVFVGLPAGPFAVSMLTPVLNEVTLVPVPLNGPAALIFDPPQITFFPDSPHVQYYTITVDPNIAPYPLGYWYWQWKLTGTDANITLLDKGYLNPEQPAQLWVVRRPPPIITEEMPESFVAGITYGPLDVTLQIPLLPGETEPLVLTPVSNALTFTPSSISFTVGQFQQVFSVRRDPIPELSYGGSDVWVDWKMTGSNAWKYEYMSLNDESPFFKFPISLRKLEFSFSSEAVVGISYTGSVLLDMAPPADLSITFITAAGVSVTPATITVTPTSSLIAYVAYQISDSALVGSYQDAMLVHIFPSLSGPAAAYYAPPEPLSITPILRQFHFVNQIGTNTDSGEQVFMLNRPSEMKTISLAAPPQSAVTLTFESEYLEFTPASLTFAPGILTQSFSFTPIAIPASQMILENSTSSSVHLVNMLISGPDASDYTLDEDFVKAFDQLIILPEIDISPIAPIYTDGRSENDVFVSIKDGGRLSPTVPSAAGAYNSFTLHILPNANAEAPPNVYVEPSVLEFSAADTSSTLRSFSIEHVSPSSFKTATRYPITYLLKWNGNLASQAMDITKFVPIHARQVLLKRYNIIPQFPKVLSYGWQEASINLTRAPGAHFALVPLRPQLDGQMDQAYGGHATAGGRLQFEPAVIVFSPGQVVQTFQVKADRGIDASGTVLYYRVDWKIVAHIDDAYNFVEYIAPRSEAGHFSTWHVADAMSLCMSVAVMLLAITAALLAL